MEQVRRIRKKASLNPLGEVCALNPEPPWVRQVGAEPDPPWVRQVGAEPDPPWVRQVGAEP